MQIQRVYRKLEQAAFRITPQRDRVVQAFMGHPEDALSADDVERLVRTEAPEPVGLATIYRTIEILAQLNLVERMPSADGRARYRLARDAVNGPHHLVCVRCGQVDEFPGDVLEDVHGRILSRHGFRIEDHELKFFGTCRTCLGDAAGAMA